MPAARTKPVPIQRWFRRLDSLPALEAWVLGIGGGAVAGAALAGRVPGLVGLLGFLAFLVAGAALALSGEPVAALEVASPSVKPLVDLVEIPGGSFLMGSQESEKGRDDGEGPVHEVRISPFACMRFPVTRRLYAELMGDDPGWPEGDADDRPVNNVYWRGAVELCNRLSAREGLEPCYWFVGERVHWNRAAGGYRLLTEAEWEYACRAGTQTRWYFGDDEGWLGDHAWYDANSNGEPQPVGRRLPNAWGLYDMHGNVWEWCWDWFDEYSAEPLHDPVGPEKGVGRAVRGGAFDDSSWFLRSAGRVWGLASGHGGFVGFRCARSSSRQP